VFSDGERLQDTTVPLFQPQSVRGLRMAGSMPEQAFFVKAIARRDAARCWPGTSGCPRRCRDDAARGARHLSRGPVDGRSPADVGPAFQARLGDPEGSPCV